MPESDMSVVTGRVTIVGVVSGSKVESSVAVELGLVHAGVWHRMTSASSVTMTVRVVAASVGL